MGTPVVVRLPDDGAGSLAGAAVWGATGPLSGAAGSGSGSKSSLALEASHPLGPVPSSAREAAASATAAAPNRAGALELLECHFPGLALPRGFALCRSEHLGFIWEFLANSSFHCNQETVGERQ
jgi:hypothetical protein